MVRKVNLVLILFFLVISFSISANGKEGKNIKQEGSSKMMGSMGMMHHGKMRKMMPMMYGMMSKSIVATKDGGVIVMIGNRLLKYDKNLNLQKEIKINVDMQQMMEKMRGKCFKMMEEEEEEGHEKGEK
jgi:hypothetical protein